jgi:hypothetical protein
MLRVQYLQDLFCRLLLRASSAGNIWNGPSKRRGLGNTLIGFCSSECVTWTEYQYNANIGIQYLLEFFFRLKSLILA